MKKIIFGDVVQSEKEYKYQTVFYYYVYIAFFAIVTSVICAKETYNTTILIASFTGVIIVSAAYNIVLSKKCKNNKALKYLYWLLMILILLGPTYSVSICVKWLLSLFVITMLISYCFYFRDVRIMIERKAILIIFIFSFAINNGINYTLAYTDNVTMHVIDKYEVRSHVPGASSKSSYLIVKNQELEIDATSVEVREDTYNNAIIGDTIQLTRRRSIFSIQSLEDPQVDSSRTLDYFDIGNYKYSDQIVVAIGVMCGILIAYYIRRRDGSY